MLLVSNSNREVVSQTKEAHGKLDYYEKKITQLLQDVATLKNSKCDKSIFDREIKYIEDGYDMMDKGLENVANNSNRIESYVENYMNIRIQNIVAETLRASLTGNQRRNHEKYDQAKM